MWGISILDLWCISFHAVVVFGLGKDLLFKSVLGHCCFWFVVQIKKSLNSKIPNSLLSYVSLYNLELTAVKRNYKRCIIQWKEIKLDLLNLVFFALKPISNKKTLGTYNNPWHSVSSDNNWSNHTHNLSQKNV